LGSQAIGAARLGPFDGLYRHFVQNN